MIKNKKQVFWISAISFAAIVNMIAAYEIIGLRKDIRILVNKNMWLEKTTSEALKGCPKCKICPVIKITYGIQEKDNEQIRRVRSKKNKQTIF